MQRILVLIGILFILGVPGTIMTSIFYATGIEQPLNHRVTWLLFELSMVILSLLIVFLIPQLKSIVMRRWHRTRVIPMDVLAGHSMQIRTLGILPRG